MKSDWRLVRLSRQNPFASSSQLQVEWSSRTSFQSYRTAQLLGPPQQAWLLQEDYCTLHRCPTVRRFQETSGIKRINWPARSADLNPIELGRRVRQRGPISIARLAAALREEWEAIPQQFIRRLIFSRPRRIREVILTRGGYTAY